MTNMSSSSINRILSRLKKAKSAGPNKWQALCPAHEDHHPSLSIKHADDGRVLLHCHAGCSLEQVCEALGIQQRDLFPERQICQTHQDIAARYKYRDEGGEVLFEVVRKKPKGFFLRRPDGKGGWINNLDGVRRVLYQLPELLSRLDEAVFVVEGEKDAESLLLEGLLATTNAGGAGKWRDEYGQVLKGREVIILPDNDDAGCKHAMMVAGALHGIAASLKVLPLPGLPQGGDVSDWLADGHTIAELRKLLAEVSPWEPPGEGDVPHDEEAERESKRHANQLVRLVLGAGIYLFHDERQEAYAAVCFPEGRRILRLNSSDFENWLSHLGWTRLHEALGSENLTAATRVLAGTARYEAKEHALNVRVAWYNGEIWLDIDGIRAIHVGSNGWQVTDKPPILFRSFPHQHHLPEPRSGGDLSQVLKFVNVRDKRSQLLLLCYLVAAMVPDIPVAALLVHGIQGSAKTTLLKVVKRLLDPSAVEVRGSVGSVAEYAQAACQNRVLFFDNLTKVSDWLSDALCRTVTGEGYSKRTLYTDEESTVFEYQRVVGLSGINLVANRSDLLDRSIIVELDAIAPDQRKEERIFWQEFDEALPFMLGGLLDALSEAIRIAPALDLPLLPRLADFARWGAAAAVVLGYGPEAFLEAYKDNVGRQNEAAIDASPVAQAVMALMNNQSLWEGTPTDLYRELTPLAEDLGLNTKSKLWPGSPTWVARRIREVQPSLLAMGIEYDETRTARQRLIAIRKISQNVVTSVTPVINGADGDESVTEHEDREGGSVTGDIAPVCASSVTTAKPGPRRTITPGDAPKRQHDDGDGSDDHLPPLEGPVAKDPVGGFRKGEEPRSDRGPVEDVFSLMGIHVDPEYRKALLNRLRLRDGK